MKILVSSNSSWNIYNFRKNILKKIDKEFDCEFIFLCPDQIYLHKIGLKKNFKFNKIKIISRSYNIFIDFFLIFQYLYYFLKHKPDIYFSYTIKANIYGSFISNFLNIKTINNFTGLGTLYNSGNFKKFFFKFLVNLSMANSKYIFFHNQDNIEHFKLNNICKKSNLKLIPGSGINLKEYLNYNIKITDKINFLFFGRVMKEKGILEYLNAIIDLKKKYSNISFSILGKKDTSDKFIINLLDNCIKNKIVKFYDFQEDTVSIVKKYSCIVLPSYHEGMSKSLLEAAALSKPLIGTNISGIKEIIEDNSNGFLAEKENTISLYKCMAKFIALNKDERFKMGLRSRKIIEKKFNEEIIINEYFLVFKSLQV